MEKIKIELNKLPKYIYDNISNAFNKEYGTVADDSNIEINLYVDKNRGVWAEVINKISTKDKNELLRANLEHYLTGRVFYQPGGIININILYEEYKKWCIYNNIPYYKSIDSFRSERFQKFLTKRGMSCNKDTIYNGILGFPG